ncbi:MAG: zinc ribbon domain-containing protein, partial [candidate division WOR-3 bacterium]
KNLEERINWCEGLVGVEEEEEKVVVKEEVPVVEPAVEEKPEELTIDEHILEEKLPEEVKKLDELLVETSNLLESEEKVVEDKPVKEAEKKEEGIACPKCGYVNPPDSWYCEKCGAEILTGS